ncbi:wax ester/triacylglycerol synthase domain-containing protein [Rhodococcus sp. NPDC003348]
MRQLSPKDAWFVYVDSPRFRQAFVSAQVFAPDDATGRLPDRAEITRWFEARAVLPMLRQRLVRVPLDLDHPYWAEDPDFAVSRHLHFHQPRGWDELRDLVAEISTVPMDQTRPLWELHVVERVLGVPGVDGPATFVAMKMHHAMTDGIGSNAVMSAFYGEQAPPPDAGRGPVERVPGPVELVLRALARGPRTAVGIVTAIRQVRANWRAVQVERAQGEYQLPPQRRTPTVLDGPVGPGRVLEVEYFSLAEVQAIKARIGGVTVNDLMLTVVGGAMRAYLLERGESVPGSLAASVPMSIRSAGAVRESNNQFVMLVVDLNSGLDDPIARARAVHEAVLAERRRMSVPAEAAVSDTTFVFPGWMFRVARRIRAWQGDARRGDELRGRPFNTFVSSVPRELTRLRLADTTDVRSLGIGPLDGTGTGHSVGVMGDRLGLNIAADPELLRDSARYAQLIRRSYNELRDAAQVTVEA